MVPPDLMTMSQAARLTEVSRMTIYGWIKAGRLTEYRRGVKFLVSLGACRKIIKEYEAKRLGRVEVL